MSALNVIEVSTHAQPDASIIWLHGLGASGHDFEPIVSELKLPASLRLRFIFPHAPTLPVTINGGMLMPAWYDILSIAIDREIDSQQLGKSADAIDGLIAQEISRGISSKRIFIAGFSQGGALAYEVALRSSQPLGGLLALSSYFATQHTVNYADTNKHLAVFIAHGTNDGVVPEILGQQAHRLLQKRGYKTTYNSYPMEHSVCGREIDDISQWLQHHLGITSSDTP
ncbi:MAG: alpha/beta fold hydrolase [Cellvibrionaceae bacterium]|nr:alpha/beta fold hydrolase [Cellvibrionaceae bacterium]